VKIISSIHHPKTNDVAQLRHFPLVGPGLERFKCVQAPLGPTVT